MMRAVATEAPGYSPARPCSHLAATSTWLPGPPARHRFAPPAPRAPPAPARGRSLRKSRTHGTLYRLRAVAGGSPSHRAGPACARIRPGTCQAPGRDCQDPGLGTTRTTDVAWTQAAWRESELACACCESTVSTT